MGNKKLEMNKVNNILLVLRTGGDYSIRDVNLLSERIVENADIEVKVWCLTNIVQQGQTVNLPYVTLLPLEHDWNGWWAKMNMFSPNLEYLRPFLYIDLDTVILKPISRLINAVTDKSNFVMLRMFFHPERIGGTSGLMWIPAKDERVSKIWETFTNNPETHMKTHRVGGDQTFINSVINAPDVYWQDLNKGIVSYKIDERIYSPTEKARVKRIKLHGIEDIVVFHGQPRIWQAAPFTPWLREYLDNYLHSNITKKFDHNIIKHINKTYGISDEQVELLYEVASKVRGITLEVGSYRGRSSCAIASGLKVLGTGRLFCIDAWEKLRNWENRKDGAKLSDFLQNIRKADCENYITPVQDFSENVFKERVYPEGLFKGKIQFLFIDADHSYDGVKSDIRWIELVSVNGFVAFHDYENKDYLGVTKAIDEFVNQNPNLLKLVKRVGSLLVFKKMK
jgi:predicted O-methyltransferase YrrM